MASTLLGRPLEVATMDELDIDERVRVIDPLRDRQAELEAVVDEVTELLRGRALVTDAHDDRRATKAHRRAPWWSAVAAALLVIAMLPGAVVMSDPAWAVETVDRGLVRVTYASLIGHGPDPAGLVDELQAHGVRAEIEHRTAWWPLSVGRITSLHTAWKPGEGALDGDRLPDPADCGMHPTVEDNGWLLDPAEFNRCQGSITIIVGRAPWQ